MPLILSGDTGISGVDGTAGTPSLQGTDSNTGVFYATDIVGIATNGTERMRIDSAGNVGIGVTPSAWRTTDRAIEIGRIGNSVSAATGGATVRIYTNAYIDNSPANLYANNGAASRFVLSDSSASIGIADSGTAGNSVTFATVFNVEKDKSIALQNASSQTGIGITFPATQSASSDANTLDDYEEGTFTPTIVYSGTNTPAYSYQLGRYTKIGRIVQMQIFFAWNENGSTGNVTVGGLPFTAVTSFARAIPTVLSSGLTGLPANISITGQVESNTTTINLFLNDNVGTVLSATYTDNDQDLYLTVTYQTT